jgi:hypothetical protein
MRRAASYVSTEPRTSSRCIDLDIEREVHMRERHTVATTALVLGVVLGVAAPALAKGENAKITISGPALGTSIVLRGDDALLWFSTTGFWDPKWVDPVVDGRMRSSIALGTAYDVRVRFGPECPGRVNETLYPFAAGGPQILMAAGQHLCGSEVLPDGYFPPSRHLMDRLVAAGFPSQTTTVSRIVPDIAVVPPDDGDVRPIGAAAAAVVLIGASGAILARRRTRRARSNR